MSSKFSLHNKSALITGGGSGIGKAITATFAQQGAFVHILDYDLKSAQETANQLNQKGFKAEAHHCDISNYKQAVSNTQLTLPTILLV